MYTSTHNSSTAYILPIIIYIYIYTLNVVQVSISEYYMLFIKLHAYYNVVSNLK